MKRIYLRTVPDERVPPGIDVGATALDWADVIRQVIRRPMDQQRGVDVAELRRGLRVLDALDRAHDQLLELEDADWEHLRDKTLAMTWGFVDRRLVTFIDDIANAGEQVPLNVEAPNGQVLPREAAERV